MRDRLESVLKRLPPVLIGVLGLQLVIILVRSNPVADLEVPVAPHWHPEEPSIGEIPTHLVRPASDSSKPAISGDTHQVASTSNTIARTNPIVGAESNRSPRQVTSSPPVKEPMVTTVGPPTRMMGGPSGMMMHGKTDSAHDPPAISPTIQARIDKITQSELLAPVFLPPPMALLGIAGHDAFLRTPNGQMSLLREGAESDGLKLVRIGTNRVLVEVAGEKKELMIFEGIGGESLLPK